MKLDLKEHIELSLQTGDWLNSYLPEFVSVHLGMNSLCFLINSWLPCPCVAH